MRVSMLRRAAGLLAAVLLAAGGCSDGTGPGEPEGLGFAVPPASTSDGAVVEPPVVVAVRDGNGNTVQDWTTEIAITLEGGGSLRGTTRRTPLAGIAIFDDLRVPETREGYRLVARSGSLAEVVSDPFDVHAIFRPASMTSGEYHTCALLHDGRAYCWGANHYGELGTGDTEERSVPTPVETRLRFSSLVAFGQHTCGLTLDAEVYCWGDNGRGQVGDGTREDRTVPTRVPLPGPAAMVDAGYWHNCALLENRTAYCWGNNSGGALGIGVADSIRVSPVRVVGDREWSKIETGYMQTCGLTTESAAYCWGPYLYGENGTGPRREEELTAPTEPVAGHHRFTELVAGGGPCHGETCGIADGAVLCWGKNYQRSVGPSPDISWLEPTPLAEDPGLVEVGPAMVCGFTAGRELYCLGDPLHRILPTTERPVPLVPELEVASLAMGQNQTCAITAEGGAYCWGSNRHGQLGSGIISLGWTEPRGVWTP